MKRKLLLTVLTTAMLATLLIGCGEKQSNKDGNTNSSSTIIEEDNNVIKVTPEGMAKEEEDETGYVEKYLEEPNWEAKFEKSKKFWIGKGKSEEEAIEKARESVDKEKFKFDLKKFVFEDMTQNFKNKKEISPTNGVYLYEMSGEDIPSFVCDVANIIPEDTDTKIYNRECYKEFSGFNVENVEIQLMEDDNPNIVVKLYANDIKVDDGFYFPMCVEMTINRNDDGTFFYKHVSIGYYIEPTIVNN